MNEFEKCPICGGVPLDKWEVTSARVFQTGQTCCGVDCNTNERWNQYATAMELAKSFVDNTVDIKTHRILHERVLEVFGK